MLADAGAGHDERKGDDHEQGEREGEPDSRQSHLPPRPPFFDVVRAIQTTDDGDHGRRAAPNSAQDAQGENPTTISVRNTPQLVFQKRQHICRSNWSKRAYEVVGEIRQGKEAGESNEKQDRGKECKEEVVRELSGEPEAIVVARLFSGPLEQFAPTQGNIE